MALLVKVRQTFGHRWMPFFLPVLASLIFVFLVVVLVPDRLSGKSKYESDSDTDKSAFPAASAGTPIDAMRLAARRRGRGGAPVPFAGGAASPLAVPQPGAVAAPTPPPPPPPAPAAPASPDGND